MSLTEIEEEARRIIEEAEGEAKRILDEARARAEELRKAGIKSPLKDEEIRKIESEFRERIDALKREYEDRRKEIRERYEVLKDEIIKELVRLVTLVEVRES